MTCAKDTKVIETMYPTSAYVEEMDTYGQKIYRTLKPNPGLGVHITRILLCSECKVKKASPRSIEENLRAIKKQEDIPTIGDWTTSQKGLAKKFGLKNVGNILMPPCVKCGNTDRVRHANGRSSLCEKCYTAYRAEYKRNYMRDFMRQKRESTHVD